ncbi:MAG: hypothetical protein QGG46_06095 [Gammaproteobacteria bacterium]|nr:hypothetical protein [Gammaproteobacteria bacterium]
MSTLTVSDFLNRHHLLGVNSYGRQKESQKESEEKSCEAEASQEESCKEKEKGGKEKGCAEEIQSQADPEQAL